MCFLFLNVWELSVLLPCTGSQRTVALSRANLVNQLNLITELTPFLDLDNDPSAKVDGRAHITG